MNENQIKMQIATSLNNLLLNGCARKAVLICKEEFNKEITEADANELCKDTMYNLAESREQNFSRQYTAIVNGIFAQRNQGGGFQLTSGSVSEIEQLNRMLGGVVATNHCADEITRQALDAQLLNVNRNSGGGVPEASAYPVLVALGILDENDAPNWYVMGGIAIASLALGIVGYRYFSSRLFSKPVQQVAEVAEKIVQKMAA